ncbi:hypothetical protein GX50_02303 [[Emmonsia] crescens]|uniref:Uncharacterized protein n=1 Tax=[Emmonsia] crescens TaxID=73230 RepID=A0A2B7ZNU6_9EURO|nr:hypothetical protein GX50_02303 [Emmonsia crescens]
MASSPCTLAHSTKGGLELRMSRLASPDFNIVRDTDQVSKKAPRLEDSSKKVAVALSRWSMVIMVTCSLASGHREGHTLNFEEPALQITESGGCCLEELDHV